MTFDATIECCFDPISLGFIIASLPEVIFYKIGYNVHVGNSKEDQIFIIGPKHHTTIVVLMHIADSLTNFDFLGKEDDPPQLS